MMSPLERALDYIGRGWAPIPIAHKNKNPNRTNWHLERYTARPPRAPSMAGHKI